METGESFALFLNACFDLVKFYSDLRRAQQEKGYLITVLHYLNQTWMTVFGVVFLRVRETV